MAQNSRKWDIIILGGGPAGLTAAIYGSRAGYEVLVLERMLPGGEITLTENLDNYPGFPEGTSGPEFGQDLEKQAKRFGASMETVEVNKAFLEEQPKRMETSKGNYLADKVIVSTGTRPRSLGVPGEDKLKGRGISYCASCDAAFFKGKEVAVVGGGDAAVEEALFLTRFAEKVYLIHRRNRLRAVKALEEGLFSNPRVEFLGDTVISEITGENKVEGVQVVAKDKEYHLPVQGVFIYIGRLPHTELLQGQLDADENGYLVTDEEMRTSRSGVFAAGDIRRKVFRQVVTAAADGAIAAYTASRELQLP